MSVTTSTEPLSDSLITTQSIVAFVLMAILAGTIGAVAWKGDPQLFSQVVIGVLGLGNMAAGFYFGSSKGSQAKDSLLVNQAPTTTTTTSGGTATTVTQPAVVAPVMPVAQPSAPAPVPPAPPAAPPA